jgi:hypothetical protein
MISSLANIDVAFKALAPRNADWASILPEICVAGLALFCLVQAMALPKSLRWLIPTTARVGLALVMIMALQTGTAWNPAEATPFFAGLTKLTGDSAQGIRCTFLLSALLTSFLAGRFFKERPAPIADYHHVLLVVTAAFMLLAQSNHFVTLFVSLETAAVGLYVLVGYLRRSQASLEAGVKYLVAGGLSSALLLMGIVLVYGSLGAPGVDSLNFDQINAALTADEERHEVVRLREQHERRGHGRQGYRPDDGRPRPHPRRRGLQARCVPFPHLDSRRLPRRAHADDGVARHRFQGRRCLHLAAPGHGPLCPAGA